MPALSGSLFHLRADFFFRLSDVLLSAVFPLFDTAVEGVRLQRQLRHRFPCGDLPVLPVFNDGLKQVIINFDGFST